MEPEWWEFYLHGHTQMSNEKKYAKLFGESLPVLSIHWVGGSRQMIKESDVVSGEFYGYAVAPEDWGTDVYRVAEIQKGDVDGYLDVVHVRKVGSAAATTEHYKDEVDL
jgi:hypothetical protein